MRTFPAPERGYMELGRWNGLSFGLNVGCIMGNLIRNSRHWMYGVEILCMLRGEHTLWVDGTEYRMRPGDVLTIDRFRSHEIYDGVTGGLQLVFNFDEALVRRTGNVEFCLNTVGPGALARDAPDVLCVRMAIARMTRLIHQTLGFGRPALAAGGQVPDAAWYEARIYLNQILMCLCRHEQPSPTPERDNPSLLASCIRDIHQNYSQSLSIAKMAEKYGYSESSLYRLFRQNLGVSFLEYLNSVRLNIACGMLLKNEHTVMEIADACGFSSYGNFYRIFREKVGVSPKTYQEQRDTLEDGGWIASRVDDPLYRYNQFESYMPSTDAQWDALIELAEHCGD